MKSRNALRIFSIFSLVAVPMVIIACWVLWPHLDSILRSWRFDRAARAGNASIALYGRVVDQSGAGVPGVTVDARISVEDSAFKQHSENLQVSTDSSGAFAIVEHRGSHLQLEVLKKPGYVLADGRMMYNFDSSRKVYVADPAHPEVFHMWKMGVAENLIEYSANRLIIPDGRIYTIDLIKSTCREGRLKEGDLWVDVKWAANFDEVKRPVWSYRLRVIDGGLIATRDARMYAAPVSGYVPVYEYVRDGTPATLVRPNTKFYVSSRNGHVFSAIHAGVSAVIPSENKAMIAFTSDSNANGSRNLQVDEKKLTHHYGGPN